MRRPDRRPRAGLQPQLAAVDHHAQRATIRQRAEQQQLRQRLLDDALDQPCHRRAPNARSKPLSASHARAAGSSSMVMPLAATIARSSSICLSTTRSTSGAPSALKVTVASSRLRNSGVKVRSSAPRVEPPLPVSRTRAGDPTRRARPRWWS
jgi:hypothetical protein